MTARRTRPLAAAAGLALAAVLSLRSVATDSPGTDTGVPLNLCDVIVRPGKPFVIAIRTCQPRGLSQGQILIRRPSKPFPEPRKAVVFSVVDDALAAMALLEPTRLALGFQSPSATVNAVHGPLLAVYLAPDADVVPGDSFTVELDVSATALFDSRGEPTPFSTRAATITVCDPDAPYVLAVGDGCGQPGRRAAIPVRAFETARFSKATALFQYNPGFFDRVADVVVWDVRGDYTTSVEELAPGEVEIRIDSSRSTIGILPGAVFEVVLVVSPDIAPGSETTIELDPAETTLVDADGLPVALELRPGTFIADHTGP